MSLAARPANDSSRFGFRDGVLLEHLLHRLPDPLLGLPGVLRHRVHDAASVLAPLVEHGAGRPAPEQLLIRGVGEEYDERPDFNVPALASDADAAPHLARPIPRG